MLERAAASESAERQSLYARLLQERRPGSRMSIVVLGATKGAKPPRLDGVDVVPLEGRWQSIARLPRCLSTLNVDMPISVIAPQSPLEEGWMALAWARQQVPVVAQVHFDILSEKAGPGGSGLRRMLGSARRAQALRLLPAYRAVRTVAPDMAAKLALRGAHHVQSIPVPIFDLDALLAVGAPPNEKPTKRVLFVGRLAPEKNLGLWLTVAGRVAEIHPGAQFDIVGGGSQRPALEAHARSLGLADRVTFHGALTRSALPAIFRRATVFLLSSDHEGFGRVLVEAMATGVAVVSTRTSGAQEVLDDGRAGLMADIGDAEGLAQAVCRLLDDATFCSELAAAGRRRILDRYRPLDLAGQWVDMLIEAAERT